jgi:hypothetical protein
MQPRVGPSLSDRCKAIRIGALYIRCDTVVTPKMAQVVMKDRGNDQGSLNECTFKIDAPFVVTSCYTIHGSPDVTTRLNMSVSHGI